MIKIENLAKGYSGDVVIHGISAEFQTGVIYGLIGPNGTGKSTLMKCLAGLYKPDQGKALLDEEEIYDNPKAKMKLAYVDEDLKYNGFYTIKKQAQVYGFFYTDFSMERFEELAKDFQLNPKEFVSNLSLGQKKKLSIALSLARKVDYLLLDEPENGLDTESRMLFRNMIKDVADEGVCVVVSSHDLANIEGLCDEILLLKHGEVIFSDTVDTLLTKVCKLVVKAEQIDLPNTYVLEAFDDVKSVIYKGNREEAQEALEKIGAKIVSFEKVNLSDAYLAYGMKSMKDE